VKLALAFAIALAAAGLAYVGAALQAFEARKAPNEQAMHASLLLTLLRRPLWLAGTAMNIIAFGLQVVALSLASLAIVQPTFALGLVVLAVVAVWKLGEKLGRREYVGIGLIIGGLTMLAFVAPRHNRLPFDGVTATVLLVALAVLATVLVLTRLLRRVDGLTTSLAAGLTYAWVGLGGTLVGEAFTRRNWGWEGVWAATTVIAAALAVLAEMTALQSWPVTRSKPVVFVLQTILPAALAPFFAARAFDVGRGALFAGSLAVLALASTAVGSSRAVVKAAG
jgi:drug/metabolite transporter (DMT)-like permease